MKKLRARIPFLFGQHKEYIYSGLVHFGFRIQSRWKLKRTSVYLDSKSAPNAEQAVCFFNVQICLQNSQNYINIHFFVASKQHGHSSHRNVRKNLESNLHDFQYNEHPSNVVCIFYRGETPAAIWRLCMSHFISLSILMLTSMDSYLHIISPWGSGNEHILRYSNLSAYVYSFVTMAYSNVFLAYILKGATFS